jgi:hypothetical protein
VGMQQSTQIIWGIVGAIVIVFSIALWISVYRGRKAIGLSMEYFAVGIIVLGLGLLVHFLVAWIHAPEEAQPSYQERLTKLLTTFEQASSEVDSVLAEVEQRETQRSQEVDRVYARLHELEQKEALLRQYIEALQKIGPEGIEYLSQSTGKDDGQSTQSGYGSFVAGAITFALVSIIARRLKRTGAQR